MKLLYNLKKLRSRFMPSPCIYIWQRGYNVCEISLTSGCTKCPVDKKLSPSAFFADLTSRVRSGLILFPRCWEQLDQQIVGQSNVEWCLVSLSFWIHGHVLPDSTGQLERLVFLSAYRQVEIFSLQTSHLVLLMRNRFTWKKDYAEKWKWIFLLY